MFRRISVVWAMVMLLIAGVCGSALAQTPEENKALDRRVLEEIWNEGKLDLIEEIYADNWVFHVSGQPDIQGIEGVTQFVTMYRTAFPDIHFTIEDQVAEGDKVASRYSTTGTHQGELMGIPPTGTQGRGTGIIIRQIADGKSVEEWAVNDDLGMLQQLGVIDAMGRVDFTWGAPSDVTGDPGDPEANKALVMRYVEEGWNQQNLDVLDEIMSPDVVNHEATLGRLVGTEAHKQGMGLYLAAFPDLHTTAEDLIAEEDLVVERWSCTGTHLGDLVGMPASGSPTTWTGITIYRVADGKIVELWWAWDSLGLMQQIGPPTAVESRTWGQIKALFQE